MEVSFLQPKKLAAGIADNEVDSRTLLSAASEEKEYCQRNQKFHTSTNPEIQLIMERAVD